MADNVQITSGSGTAIAADDIGSVWYQRVKLAAGADGSATDVSAAAPLPIVGLGGKSIAATLTVTNGTYAASDVVGGLITFANATRINAGHAIVNSVKLAGVVALAYELWLLNADLATPAADNAAFALASADLPKVLGVIPISTADYNAAQSSHNVATVRGVGLEVKAATATTTIYGYLKATTTTSPGTTTVYLTLDVEYLD